jgi:hypothetical protein
MNLSDEDVVGANRNIEMDLGPAVSFCDKCALGVNDDGGGGYSPRDFACPSKGPKNHVVRVQLAA